jgi:hypothetical protein
VDLPRQLLDVAQDGDGTEVGRESGGVAQR